MMIRAPAKINLGLTVLGRRTDGFHEIETVMQQVSLADTIILQQAEQGKLIFSCTDSELSTEDNLVFRAANLLKNISGKCLPGVSITLYKNIPVAAGLAGGSSDAAAALFGLNKFWQLGLDYQKLARLASELGSDVPFCLEGGTALAQGRGEILEKLPEIPFFWVTLVLPSATKISTAEAYAKYNRDLTGKPRLDDLLMAVRSQNRLKILKWTEKKFVNTLESADLDASKKIRLLKEQFRSYGLKLSMSGSGPALFLLSENMEKATWAAGLAGQLGAEAYLCWTDNNYRWC